MQSINTMQVSLNSSRSRKESWWFDGNSLPYGVGKNVVPFQGSLAKSVTFQGQGIHLAKEATVTVSPASPDTGIVFIRRDLPAKRAVFHGSYDYVGQSKLATRLLNDDGDEILTIEHLVAAMSGLGITNAYVEISGNEVPILDGSAKIFVDAFKGDGNLVVQCAYQNAMRIKREICFEEGASSIVVRPSSKRILDYQFDGYGRMDALLSRKVVRFHMGVDDFSSLIAPSRTFGFYEDAAYLQSQGMALGASLDNTVVLKDGKIVNEGGLRFRDEFVRHKILDLMGDFALSNVVILGHIHAKNTGHDFNNRFLRYLFDQVDFWDYVG